MAAVLLALTASVWWGVSDFLGGLSSRRLTVATVMSVAMPVGLVGIGIVVAVRWQPPPNASFALWATITGVVGGIGIAALYRGLAVGRMGIVAPISATAPLIPVAFGLARGERPGVLQGVGMGLALVGVVLAGRERDKTAGRRMASGASLAVVAALCFGGGLISLDEASNEDPYWATFVIRAVSTIVIGVGVLVTRQKVSRPGSLLPALVAVGLLDMGGTVLFAVSTTKGLISVVAVLVSLFPVVVALLARIWLHERLERVQLLGAAAAIAGVAFISAG